MMHGLRVAIRADASVAIGSGHLMRCAALAGTLRARGAEVAFVCRSAEGDLCGRLEAAGFAVHRLAPAPTGWQEDAAATRAALGSAIADWLVVDHYQLDARWEKELRASARCILAIDDLADRPHACDVLLDQNFYPDSQSRYAGQVPQHCVQLLGPGYALLRAEFALARARRRPRSGEVGRILCFFGGSDAGNATGKALDALALLALPGIAVDVVVGASNPWREQIGQRCKGMHGVFFHCQANNMAELMLAADLSIGAGGSASWERCCLGLPGVALTIADNQVEVTRALDGHGCLRYLGGAAEATPASLAQALAGLIADRAALRAMSDRGATLVDGAGCARVADRMAGRIGAAPIRLRNAETGDASGLLEWRNAPEVRAASFDPRLIEAGEHQRWLAAVLADPARHLLIAEQDGQPVAVLRYDVKDQEAEVSVFLLPGLSGRGLGTSVLEEGNRWVRTHLPQLARIRARILAANPASRTAFRKAGFAERGEAHIFALDNSADSATGKP